MDPSCIFCRIVNGEMGTEFVAESEHALAFNDISPTAPVHVLIIPKRHVSSLRELNDSLVAADLLSLASQVAKDRDLYESGYRVVINDGEEAGQTVFHLHVHVLGGHRLGQMG